MKLVRGHKYQGTAIIPLLSLGIFDPEKMARDVLTEFGFVDVTASTTIPENWPEAHRDGDVFASGTWGKETGEYPVPEAVSWIFDVTPEPKLYAPGPYYIVLSPASVLGPDVHEREGFEAFLAEQEKIGALKVTKNREEHGGPASGGTNTLYEFKLLKTTPWLWTSEHTHRPDPGTGEKEFELTPGQAEYVNESKDAFEGGVKKALLAVAGIGVGLVVLNSLLSRGGK